MKEKEEIINVMNSVHIDVVDDEVKIKCEPERDSLPITVVEEIVKSTIKQCRQHQEKDAPDSLMDSLIEKYDAHVFKTMLAWKTVSFILAAIIVVLLIYWR